MLWNRLTKNRKLAKMQRFSITLISLGVLRKMYRVLIVI